jgi:hypothetical protein
MPSVRLILLVRFCKSNSKFSWQSEWEKPFESSTAVAAYLTPDMSDIGYNSLSGVYVLYTNGEQRITTINDYIDFNYSGLSS